MVEEKSPYREKEGSHLPSFSIILPHCDSYVEVIVLRHYFIESPESHSAPQTITVHFQGRTLHFLTDHDVFSKDALDRGSRLLLETFLELVENGHHQGEISRLLDMGCGWGAIGIILAMHFPKAHCVLVDHHPRAVRLAQENIRRHGLTNAEVYLSDGIAAIPDERFDAVLLNPPIHAGKETVFHLYRDAYTALQDGGALWVVIQKKHGAPSTLKYLQTLFEDVHIARRQSGYQILRAVKNAK